MAKKKIATVWLGGCSGCHMSLLDIDERILEVAKLADIVKSPIVDGKEFPEVDVAIVEGACALDEHFHEAEEIRKRSKVLVSLGDCAINGNVAAMRNWIPKEDVFKRSYLEVESHSPGQVPLHPALGKMVDRVVPLHEVVPVDYYIPGCPPKADLIFEVLFALLTDQIPNVSELEIRYG